MSADRSAELSTLPSLAREELRDASLSPDSTSDAKTQYDVDTKYTDLIFAPTLMSSAYQVVARNCLASVV